MLISSDLVAAVVSLVHMRKGTVNWRLAGWMCLGSVPMAFAGAYLLHLLGGTSAQQDGAEIAGTAAMVVGSWLDSRSGRQRTATSGQPRVGPSPTLLTGAAGGLRSLTGDPRGTSRPR